MKSVRGPAIIAALMGLSAACATAQSASPLDGDASLAAMATVEVSGEPLADILDDLQMAGHAALRTGREEGYERISVYARNRSRREVMAALATLLDYRWSRDATPDRYTLAAGISIRHLEAGLERQTRERGAAPLSHLTTYLRLPEEHYAEIYQRRFGAKPEEPHDPLLRDNAFYLGRSGPRMALDILTTLSPEQRDALLYDGRVTLSPDRMNGRQEALTRSMGLDQARLLERIGKALPGETPEAAADLASQTGLRLTLSSHPVTGVVTGFGYGIVGRPGEMAGAMFHETPPPETVLPVRGDPYVSIRRPKPPVYAALEGRLFPSDFKLDSRHTPLWREVMGELAKRLPEPIFSDEYRFVTNPVLRTGSIDWYKAEEVIPDAALGGVRGIRSMRLPQALDELCRRYGYLWWYQDGALFFRSRTWFLERAYEIPPPVAENVLRQVQRDGRLDVGSITLLMPLTRSQLAGWLAANRPTWIAAGYNGEAIQMALIQSYGLHACLRVVMLLSTLERTRLIAGENLSFATLSPAAQSAMVQALLTSSWRLQGDVGIIRLAAVQTGNAAGQDAPGMKQVRLSFTWREPNHKDISHELAEIRVYYSPPASSLERSNDPRR